MAYNQLLFSTIAGSVSAIQRASINSSILKRPPYVSFDYLTAFDIGPVEIQDTSEGINSYVWKAFVLNGKEIWVDRANAFNTAWRNNPIKIYEHPEDIWELSFTFDQAGNPFFAFSSGTSIFLEYMDGDTNLRVTRNIAEGKSPVCCLDERRPELSNISDVIVFYVDSIDDEIVYLYQRDLYNVKYNTGITDTAGIYLEDLGMAGGYRLKLTYLDIDQDTGIATVKFLHSDMYPLVAKDTPISMSTTLLGVLMRSSLWEYGEDLVEVLSLLPALNSVTLAEPLNKYTQEDVLSLAPTINDILLKSVMNYYNAAETDIMQLTPSINSVFMVVKLYKKEDFGKMSMTPSLNSTTLEVV